MLKQEKRRKRSENFRAEAHRNSVRSPLSRDATGLPSRPLTYRSGSRRRVKWRGSSMEPHMEGANVTVKLQTSSTQVQPISDIEYEILLVRH